MMDEFSASDNTQFSLAWPFAYGKPEGKARFRMVPEDFIVDEIMDFAPANTGEHVLLHIRKRGENTDWVARQIATVAGVERMDVGYCGKKDRHALTSQWFSVYLPKAPEPNWSALQSETIEILHQCRHTHKLRPGQHSANCFVIRLRELTGDTREALTTRLEKISAQGAPNYYGEQRFGREGSNLHSAQAWLERGERIRDKGKRGMVLSAARSFLFNQVLAERVHNQTWLAAVAGDPAQAPSGPLWGRGRPLSSDNLGELEQRVLAPWSQWCDGLEHVGLSQERRPLVLRPDNFTWSWESADLVLKFQLPPGFFATALLRELAQLQ